MSHTEGKLTLSKNGVIRAGEFHQYTNGKAQSQFAMVACPDEWQAEEGVTQEENARRLVACWNYCGGVPTHELEKMEPDGDALRGAYAIKAHAEIERDELVKALRKASIMGAAYYGLVNEHKLHQVFLDADAILARYPEGKS